MNNIKKILMIVFVFILSIAIIMVLSNILLFLLIACTGLEYSDYYSIISSIYTVGGIIGVFMYVYAKKWILLKGKEYELVPEVLGRWKILC